MVKGALSTNKRAAGPRSGRDEVVVAWLPHLTAGRPLDAAGELELVAVVREGAWGAVLQARHLPTQTLRAVKVLRPELVDSEGLRVLFEEGLEKAATVEGEVAVRIFNIGRLLGDGSGVLGDFLYYVMDWVEGRTLRDLLVGGQKGRGLSLGGLVDKADAPGPPRQGLLPEQVFSFVGGVAQGVTELHRAGVTHLDIKPEHVMLARKNQVRLVGYGLALGLRRHGDELLGIPWRSVRHAPPELAAGDWERVGPAADIYQLGMLTYELLTGHPCSPWYGYEELCETVSFVPPTLDDLVQDCLGEIDKRPVDAEDFLLRLANARAEFEEAERRNRARPERRAREIWMRAQELAGQQDPGWGRVQGMCQRLLEEKPHLLPFGKIPVRDVQALLGEAQARLQRRRRAHLDTLVDGKEWRLAASFIEQLGGEVSTAELGDLTLTLELTRLVDGDAQPERRAEGYRRIVDLLKEPTLDAGVRQRAADALEKLVLAKPTQVTPPAISVLTDLGSLSPVDRFRVEVGSQVESWWVVVGPSVRLGRGSFEDFGNHIDLRPTKREAAESSVTIALAQQVSRAGHLEMRVGPSGLEAFCMGSQGATVDGRPLKRGERVALGERGACVLAQGATELAYEVVHGRQGAPIALLLSLTGGVGAGRRVIWVLGELPLGLLCPASEVAAALTPTSAGWTVQPASAGLQMGERLLAAGVTVPWASDGVLEVAGHCRISRGHT
jgi:serine/threonine protein kinase